LTKIKVLFLLFLFSGLILNAQIEISGKVINPAKESVAYANVLLKKGDSIINYTATDNNGSFFLSQIKPGSYNLAIKALGYAEQTRQLNLTKNKPQINLKTIVLKEKVEKLNEVFIEMDRPIEVRGDTVAVTMEYFRDSTEQNVEELLRQVPGLNIDRSGTIKVGNQEIEKIMVEGDDFFSKGYKILSKNMPAYPVNKVQIIKNYTENRLLDGLVNSNKIALNLKLDDKYKRKWFGNLKGGLGTNDFYKFKGNLMNFGKKTKYYFLTDLNNTGTDVTGNIKKLTQTQNSSFNDGATAPRLLSLPGQKLYLRDTRTNFNKASLVSLNAIFNPTDSLKIKPLVFFNSDRNQFFKDQVEMTNVAGSEFTNETDYDLNKKKRIAFGKLEVNFDIAENQKIESTTQYENGDFRGASQLIFNKTPVTEEIPRDNKRFNQSINYTNRLADDQLLSLAAQYSQEKNNADYRINRFYYENLFPSNPQTDRVEQKMNSKSQFTGINARYRKKSQNGNLLKLKMGYKYRKNKINSRFSLLKKDSLLARPDGYQNETDFQSSDLFLKGGYKLNLNQFKIIGSIEFHQLFRNLKGNELNENKSSFFVNPEISLNWSIDNDNSINLNYSYQTQNPGIIDSYSNYVLTGYRTFAKGTGSLNQVHSSQWSLSYRLGNWTDRFFTAISSYYNYDYDFLSTNKIISQNYNRYGKILIEDRSSFGINSNSNYFLSSLSSNLRADFNYSRSNFKNRVNNLKTRNVISNNYSYGLRFKTAFEGIFNFTLGTDWQSNKIETSREISYTNNNTYINFSFVFNPRFDIDLSATRYHLGQVDKKDDYYFMDFSTDYKLIKNKLTVGLQGKNLFDTRTFKRYSISDIGSSVTKYRLLPRMLLFTAEYRF